MELNKLKKEQIKYRIFVFMIFLSLCGITITSMSHLTKTFSFIQYGEYKDIISFLMAFSIEIAMLGIAFGIAENRRKKDVSSFFSNLVLYIGLILFFIINFYGNTYHAINVYLKTNKILESFDLIGIDILVWIMIIITSSVLPVLILILTELFVVFYNKLEFINDTLDKKYKYVNRNKGGKQTNKKSEQKSLLENIKGLGHLFKKNPNEIPTSNENPMNENKAGVYQNTSRDFSEKKPDQPEIPYQKSLIEQGESSKEIQNLDLFGYNNSNSNLNNNLNNNNVDLGSPPEKSLDEIKKQNKEYKKVIIDLNNNSNNLNNVEQNGDHKQSILLNKQKKQGNKVNLLGNEYKIDKTSYGKWKLFDEK